MIELRDHGRHGAVILDGRKRLALTRPLGHGMGWRVALFHACWLDRRAHEPSRVTGKIRHEWLDVGNKRDAMRMLRGILRQVKGKDGKS